ncbi:MAG: transcription termination factor NusA [Spirochaetaceae bacterium]|jgi:N utilization substance protein A|nr:transcription termination factor NusA [Spirochaetaceae bacterium]
MALDLHEEIQQLMQEKGMSEELVARTIENLLVSAYKRKFGHSENVLVRFSDDKREVSLLAKKVIVDELLDDSKEIAIAEAHKLAPDAELGDEMLIELDPRKDFARSAVVTAKHAARQYMREITKDSLYAEYKEKEGEIITGYYQRERNNNIYVDIGKIEGVLPKRFQSPREIYHVNDRVKALVLKVEKTATGLQVVLSRTHTDFVRAIFETEVPEIYDKVVEIHKIVREPGYRTKLAVFSSREDIDPVGACVGMKGARIQAVIRELEGEKIDVLKFETDPVKFVKNALSPAEVRDVIILDEAKKQALAVVNDSQLSLAIGKQGLNVRLANRLCDWNIDVKTAKQFEDMDISSESRKAVSRLFGDADDYEDEIYEIRELPSVDMAVADALAAAGLDYIEDFINAEEERLAGIEGVTPESLTALRKLIEEYVEVVEEGGIEDVDANVGHLSAGEAEAEVEEYECPECGAKITLDMTVCPGCGVGLSFEYE